jgi:hypothetical protein
MQSRRRRSTSDGCPPLGLGVGITTSHRKNKLFTKCHKWLRALADFLDFEQKLLRERKTYFTVSFTVFEKIKHQEPKASEMLRFRYIFQLVIFNHERLENSYE